ncbi:MAG: hypothetical protein AB1530_04090 [Candidatus Omnitrophota bacterium]
MATKDNGLTFWLNEPPFWKKENNLPNKIRFFGTWQLDKNNDLVFVLDKDRYQNRGEQLVLKSKLLAVEANSVVFSISSYKEAGGRLSRIQTFRLTGLWQADRYNRLNFSVGRKFNTDTLVFQGSWQINKNQELVYVYEKTNLKTKTRISKELIFRGYWQIVHNRRLAYILSRNRGSCFEFRVQLQTPNLYPQEGKIKFRLGAGLKKSKHPMPRIICLYGEWKFSRTWGLLFAMDYGAGIIRNLEFGFTVAVRNADSITLNLTDKQHNPLGITVTFTHRFLEEHGAGGFIRLRPEGKQIGLEAGLTFPF